MHKLLLKIALCWAVFFATVSSLHASEWQFDGASRIVAIADVHGAYDAMVDAMQAANVIDEELAWTGRDTHLVMVGDLLDRGPDSRSAMDLLMRLEVEAEAAGGRVHVLIGNHEAMNLVGDLRYVSSAEYAAFADEETETERDRWFAAWTETRAPADHGPEGQQVLFQQQHPPGFFAHRREFLADGRYGAWLLSKPVIVVINGTAFVHGGLSPMVAEIGLDGVNGKLRGEMVEYVEQLGLLYAAGALIPSDNFHDHPAILRSYTAPLDASTELLDAIETVKNLNGSNLHALEGPLWYRGNVVCSALIEADRLGGALDAIGAKRVVIGHSPTPGRKVLERLDGRVVEIDTGMLNAYYGGSANALVIDDTGIAVVNQDTTTTTPVAHPRRVGTRPSGSMSVSEIESLLKDGEIVGRRSDEVGRDIVTVSDGSRALEATFTRRPGRGTYPDVAAYRLDRMIGLDMVPAAVVRKVGGADGSLQFLPKNWIDEMKRQAEGSGGSAWCPVPEQWQAMFIFDMLIYNEGRNGRNLMYGLDYWQVMLTGHAKAFSTRKGVPPRLRQVEVDVGSAWKEALGSLDETRLAEALGDVLDDRRIRALAARAEALLETG